MSTLKAHDLSIAADVSKKAPLHAGNLHTRSHTFKITLKYKALQNKGHPSPDHTTHTATTVSVRPLDDLLLAFTYNIGNAMSKTQ